MPQPPLPCVQHAQLVSTYARTAFALHPVQKGWEAYVEGMRNSGFNTSLPVYVASGLLTYNATERWRQLVERMRTLGLAAEVLHKEGLPGGEDLQGECGRNGRCHGSS